MSRPVCVSNRNLSHVRFLSWITLLSLAVGCTSPALIPETYTNWNDNDGAFSIDYPTGWSADGGGKHGVKWAEFTSGSAIIRLDFDTSSSVVGDIASGGRGATNVEQSDDPTLAPVHKAHLYNKGKTEEQYSNYSEGEPIPYRSKLGDSRKSEFTSTAMSGKINGYRSTSLTVNNGVLIRCTCPSGEWKKLRPVFDKVLSSVGYGQ